MVGSQHGGSSENTSYDLGEEKRILLVVKRTRKGGWGTF
jgi:hypothetical protein